MVNDMKRKVLIPDLIKAAADPEEFAACSERYYRDQTEIIADLFCSRFPENQVILLAGPSSSGKTTTALNLDKTLRRRGFRTMRVSLDDFFLDRDAAPLLEDGSPDLETVDLLDIPLLNQCFDNLFATGVCEFPVFDFRRGCRSEETRSCMLDSRTAIIIEGLHALNPKVSGQHFCKSAIKIYISIKTEFYLGEKRLLSTRELRLIRRIIRDENFRATCAADTMYMWKNVVRGEDQYIRPFRLESDYWVDSVHYYEPFLYKDEFFRITDHSAWHDPKHGELIEKLRSSLQNFPSVSRRYVPQDSLLREFIILP